MSDERRTPMGGTWRMPPHEPGDDPAWDRLGPDWKAVDGVIEGVRIYAKWERDEGQTHLRGLCFSDVPITADLLRAVPVGRLENFAAAAENAMPADEFFDMLDPLHRHAGEPPEDFARRVAYYYRMFSGISSKPAKLISDHSSVPLPTVHGWIREARLRGYLPPGKRGKAG